MSIRANAGSPVVYPQRYHTVPITLIAQAEQCDRQLHQSELKTLLAFFQSGEKRLHIAELLHQHATEIVRAGADRIFYAGTPMAYLEAPPNRENLPGYSGLPMPQIQRPSEALKVQPQLARNPIRDLWRFLAIQMLEDREPLPAGFRPIHVMRYGEVRMQRSMRDLDWFLRYATYAIVAGNSSILTTNVRGLRGVIPEDVTEATIVGLKDMRWKALSYFKSDDQACEIIREVFDMLIAEYQVEKPPLRVRQGNSQKQQGLVLPESYVTSEVVRSRFVMKPHLSATERDAVIKAAYRQVFERDVTREYGVALTDLESKFKGGQLSTKEFIRQLCQSPLYRKLFYEPCVLSRSIELAVRHCLGRGLSSLEEFRDYFELVTKRGFPALIDRLVDSTEYFDYFGEETVPYLRDLGQEAQECRNWSAQRDLFKFNASVQTTPKFVTLFGYSGQSSPNQHVYGLSNDPIDIPFSAIFPQKNWNHHDLVVPSNKDNRRILIQTEPSNGHTSSVLWNPEIRHQRILTLHSCPNGHNADSTQQALETLILGAYRQILGRDIYPYERLPALETKLKGRAIPVREFVRQVAKSRLFRRLYWEPLYVTKAIEAMHRRLLGRPTYGRQEMGRYYGVAAKSGFLALVDALIDSAEYEAAFGEETVPYDRYLTPRGFEMRFHRSATYPTQLHERPGSPVDGVRVADGDWMKVFIQKMQAQPQFNFPRSIVEPQTHVEPLHQSHDVDQIENPTPMESPDEMPVEEMVG